jgi:hypothetical protein
MTTTDPTPGPREDRYFESLPSGASRFVTAAFSDLDDALDATKALEKHAYDRERISVFMATETRDKYIDAHPRYEELEEDAVMVEEVELSKKTKSAEGAGVGGAIGGALGAAGAAIAAVGTTLVIPPLGIALAGPVAAALAGLGAGALSGGLVGALVGAGMSEYRAEHFERLIKDGHVMVGVTVETEPERQSVLEILESHSGDTGPSAPEERN